MERSKAGTAGWVGLGIYVAAWDILAPETLTSAFKRGREHKAASPLVVGALGVTALHLMGVLPEKIDPFYAVFEKPKEQDNG